MSFDKFELQICLYGDVRNIVYKYLYELIYSEKYYKSVSYFTKYIAVVDHNFMLPFSISIHDNCGTFNMYGRIMWMNNNEKSWFIVKRKKLNEG